MTKAFQRALLTPYPLDFLKRVFQGLQKWKVLLLCLSLGVGQALFILLPAILGLLIESVWATAVWPVASLLLFPAVWLAATLFLSLSNFITSYVMQDVRKSSKRIVFQHLLSTPTQVFYSKNSGAIESLLQELSFGARYLFSEGGPFFIRIVTSIVVALASIALIMPGLFWIFALWSLAYLPLSYYLAKQSVRYVQESIESSAQVSGMTIEAIENHELIPIFGTEADETHRYDQILEQERLYYNRAKNRINGADLLQRLALMVLPCAVGIALVISGGMVSLGAGTIAASLSLILIFATQISHFGRGVLGAYEMVERMGAALRKLQVPQKWVSSYEGPYVTPERWDLRLDGVSYHYDDHPPIFEKLNLVIADKEKVGIVGYSGAGKTTLLKLLRGIYQPTEGDIFIGNVSINEVAPKTLASNFSEVSQTIPLLHRSVRENVAYGSPEVPDEKVWDVLERAQLMNRFKDLDVLIGSKGQKLSGGERARLGIARAFMRDSRVIILDEAMAALDGESEALIQKGLEELMDDRTVIAVAHRLSTLKKMDRLLLMDQGRIVADGTHETLLEESALYRQLWDHQRV